MTYIKSVNWLSYGRWALTHTQVHRPKELLLVEKLRKFIILGYILITTLSHKHHTKKHLNLFLDDWLTFEEHLKVSTTKVNKTVGLLFMTKLL